MTDNKIGNFDEKKNYDNMDNDIDTLLSYENPDFMSSEFFDSILSLENNMDQDFLSGLEDEIQISSDSNSQIDEVLSPQSFYSESDKNSSYTENSDDLTFNTHEYESTFSLQESAGIEAKEDSIQALLTPQKTETKIYIQNPNNKKIIAKSILSAQQFNSSVFKDKSQIFGIQSTDNNVGPILLPFNIKNLKLLKTSSNITLTSNLKNSKKNSNISSHNTETGSYYSHQYPPLTLTQEEKRLLAKEGIKLPAHHPLTKNEERELKRIRRKIRNKISAQDSRKRKKEYVDGLEERVKRGTEENKNLLQRVRALQRQNKSLIAHVNKLHNLIKNSSSSKATTSTCLMVVLLSALLVSLPNMKLIGNKLNESNDEQVAIRRSLLSSSQLSNEDNTLNMEEFLIFKDEEKVNFSDEVDSENITETEFSNVIQEMEKEYEKFLLNNNSKMSIFGKVFETFKRYLQKEKPEFNGKIDYGGYANKNGFLEPDIDEYLPTINEEPTTKRMKYSFDIPNPTNNEVILKSADVNKLESRDK